MKKVVSLFLMLPLILVMAGTTLFPTSAEELGSDSSPQGAASSFYYECPDRSSYQLTKEQLHAPTEQLLNYILACPYIVDLYTSSSPDIDAYQCLKAVFNGLEELERRSDAASTMLRMYVDLSSSKSDCLERTHLKTLLTVPVYFSKLTEPESALYLRLTGAVP